MSFFDDASLAFLPSSGAGKDGKAYSIKPTTGAGDFTFSRGSNLSATRVGPTGLIEKGRENLLLQSNQFDTTWFNINTTETGGQADKDGGSTAWLIEKSASSAYIGQSVSQSGVSTASVYAKAGDSDWIHFLTDNGGSSYFDLINGAIGANSGLIDAKIESIGNGWYRCIISQSGGITRVRIYPAETNSVSATSGSIYIQDAQFEIGLAATDYIETGATTGKAGLLEDEPRFDYSGGATCPSLLLEPSRTQLLPYTEWIGGWSDVNDATIDGPQSFTLGSTAARIQAGSIGGPSGDFVFYAVFDSADIGKTIRLAYFDSTASSWNTGSNITIDSNGRAERLISTGSNVIGNVAFYGTSTSQSFTLKYCQFEQGSYPTSYIPNHSGTGSVTRGADVCGDAGDASTFNSTEGVLFAEIAALADDGTYRLMNIIDVSNTNNFIYLGYKNDSNTIRTRIEVGGIASTDMEYVLSNETEFNKIAVKWKTNDFALWVNGVEVATDSSGVSFTANTLDKLSFDRNGGLEFNGKVNALQVYKEALTDAELATLTTI